MPQTAALPRGVGSRVENIFIEMAQVVFSMVDDFLWDPDPEKSKIFVSSEGSEIEMSRLPQIRVSVGDLTDFEGSIDRQTVWALDTPEFRFIDQAYVMFSVYAGKPVEARDIADYLKDALYMARSDIGREGIFALRSLGSAQPRAMEKAARTDSVSMATVTSAFMASRKVTIVNEDGPRWDRVVTKTVDKLTEITDIGYDGYDLVAPVKSSQVWGTPQRIDVTFDLGVGPFRPSGFTATDDTGSLVLSVQRSMKDEHVLQLVLDRLPDGVVNVTYSGTGLYDYLEEILVETFAFAL
jgi:hypothetical protein